jgi:hypothetical protein
VFNHEKKLTNHISLAIAYIFYKFLGFFGHKCTRELYKKSRIVKLTKLQKLIYLGIKMPISFPGGSEFDPFQVIFEECSCSLEAWRSPIEDESISSLPYCRS